MARSISIIGGLHHAAGDVKKALDTDIREVGLAAAEGLGIEAGWVQRWEKLWEDLEAQIRIGMFKGGKVRWERGVVQGGQTSPGHYAIASLYIVRGIKREFKHAVQIMVADDGLVGIELDDLEDLAEYVISTYRGVYMDISQKKQRYLGWLRWERRRRSGWTANT